MEPARDDFSLAASSSAATWQPRRKFQDRVWLHVVLLLLTFATTTLVGTSRSAVQAAFGIAAWPTDAPRLMVVRAVAEREVTFAVGQARRHFDAGYAATKQALS